MTARYIHGGLLDSGFLDAPARGGWRQKLGVLFDLGPHLLDLVDAASGPIVSILASGDPQEAVMLATEHAGGASKNRRFDGTIRLSAGEYVLRYETDGSHAFGDWNADPPDDPEMWGITVSQAAPVSAVRRAGQK